MKITVAGCGRWGSFIAWYLNKIGHDVTLYGRPGSKSMESFIKTRKSELLELPESVKLTQELKNVINSDVLVISIASQALDGFSKQLAQNGFSRGNVVLCMKGIEISTGRRLSQIISDNLPDSRCAVWLGPGHVQEFLSGIPNCMVIDSLDEELKHMLVDGFSGNLIRFYYGTDLIGNEIGAAAKNVIGIAAGMLDALKLGTLKGALMSRGTREIARFIKASGGNELSAYGLCHLGDYEATVFSPYSHNRMFGEKFVKNEPYDSLAEGYYTVKALVNMAEKLGVELPICRAVYDTLYLGKDTAQSLDALFSRSIKKEF